MKEEYDFSKGKRGAVIPNNGKTRITMWLDDDVLEEFRDKSDQQGIGYQTLINQSLRIFLETGKPLDEGTLRRIIREEMHSEAA